MLRPESYFGKVVGASSCEVFSGIFSFGAFKFPFYSNDLSHESHLYFREQYGSVFSSNYFVQTFCHMHHNCKICVFHGQF